MGVILEIKSGDLTGKVIALTTGKNVTVGRATGKSDFALPQDTFLSGLHFAVECSPSGCRVVDRKSSNGTFLNGAKIQEAMLANGDEIKAGKTVFLVRILSDEKIAAMLPQRAAEPPAAPPQPPRARQVEPPPASRPRPVQDVARPRQSVESSRLPLDASGIGQAAQQPVSRLEPAQSSDVPLAKQPPKALEVSTPEARRVERRSESSSRQELSKAVAEPPQNPSPAMQAPAMDELPSPDLPSRPREISREPIEKERPPRAVEPPASQRPSPIAPTPDRSGSQRATGRKAFAFSIGGWSFPAAPPDWTLQEGFGLQRAVGEDFPSSVSAAEEVLSGITLPQFVESQISMLRGYLRDPQIEPTMPPRLEGADETMGVDVRHATKDGRELAYRHIYARSGSSVGILTVTTLASEFPKVLESLEPVLSGAAFHASVLTS